jgi:hypothetical protein
MAGSQSPDHVETSVKTSPERDISISQLVDGGNESARDDATGEDERGGGREYPGSIPLAANTHLPVVEQPILVGYFPLTLFIAVVGDGVPVFDPGVYLRAKSCSICFLSATDRRKSSHSMSHLSSRCNIIHLSKSAEQEHICPTIRARFSYS